MEIHCSLRIVARTIITAFLGGLLLGGSLAGYSPGESAGNSAPAAVQSAHDLLVRGRIIGGASSFAGPAR